MKHFTRLLSASILAIGLIAVTMPACADEETRTGWQMFVEETWGRYGASDPANWEDVLYAASQATKTEDEAIVEFGRRIGVDTSTARRYADVLIEAVAFREASRNDRAPKVVPFAPGQKLYDLTAEVAMKEPKGQLLFIIGTVVDAEPQVFIRLAKTHPAAVSVFFRLADYGTEGPHLIAALQGLPADPSGLMPQVLQPRWSDNTPDSESLRLGAVEATYARLARTPQTQAWRAALSRYMMLSLLDMGLDAEAVALYREAADELLPVWLETRGDDKDAVLAGNVFARNMAAALWRQGDAAAGRALIGRLAGKDEDTDLVRDAFSPIINDAELFDLYVLGRPCAKDDKACKRSSREGSLGFALGATPAIKALLAERLDRAGYRDIGSDVAVPSEPYFGRGVVGYDGIDDLVPEGAAARAAVWKARIAAWREGTAKASVPTTPVTVTVTKLPAMWTEKPLPAGIRPWSDDDTAPEVPAKIKLPVPSHAVLRHEGLSPSERNKDGAVLYETARYDLPGEIPAYGLWMSLRHDNAWGPELYLGLQQHFPYVATAGSRLPLINRDDPANPRLQVEVRVEEIDPKTITFPPVGLSFAREAGGLYLDIPLAAVTQDGDGDGMTDIEEAKLGLKPDQKDSDGDGVDDGFDPMPLTAYRAATDEATALVARTVLEKVMGHDKGAIMIAPRRKSADKPGLDDDLAAVLGGGGTSRRAEGTFFLVADAQMFAGIVNVPRQFIVYSPADLKALGRDGVFYPPRLTRFYRSLDGKRWFVDWSAGWIGGSFMIDCSGKACKTEDLSSWIT